MSAGIQNQIGIGKESTFGTPVAPTVFIPIKESDGIQINQDIQFLEAIKGTAPKNKGAFVGKIELSGGYESDTYPVFLGHVLLSAFGALNSAQVGGETIVYKHTFTEGFAKQSYTVEQKIGEIVKRFAGYIVKNIKIEGKVGEAVGVSFDGMGKSQADASLTTRTYENTRPFNFADVVNVRIGAVEVKAQCEEFSLEYDNGLEAFYGMGSNNLQASYPTPSECKGKLTLYLDNTTKDFLADYIAKTERSLEIKIEGDAIGNSSKYALRAYLPRAVFTSVPMKLANNYNAMEIEFEGVEDTSNGLVTVELTNLLTSY